MLRSRLVQVGVGLELEQQVDDVNQEKDNTCSTADFERHQIGFGFVAKRGVERGGENQTNDTQTEQASTHLRDGAVIDLETLLAKVHVGKGYCLVLPALCIEVHQGRSPYPE